MAIKNHWQQVIWSIIVGLCLVLSSPCLTDNTQKQLQHVKQQIHLLQKEISQQEKAKQAAKHSIKASQKALKKTRALVNALIAEHHTSQKKLSSLYQNLHAIQKRIDQISATITGILQKQYVRYRQFATTQLSTAHEVTQQTRLQSYYQYIAKAQQQLILQLQAQQAQLANLSSEVKRELHRLDQAATQKKIEKNKLEAKKNQSYLQEKKLAKNIQYKKQYLAKLLASEKKLSALIATLQRQTSAKTKIPASQKSGTQNAEQVKAVADASASGKKFLALKGKMKLPMAGTITGKFGKARSAEGGTWKGLFISTNTKQSIHAVADGTIAHTGYITGLGQVSIVEHGKQYFTVYAGLSSVSLPQGQKVKAGSVLGQSGVLGSGEVGLYFEIRHMGQPINPLNWIVH
ncbi:MAG: peptidoglycan DD-metalloendopeptidase family protein [Neisseriales bacterium]|nr:MAG: peptidoglycan DD-metalloendopeptidase family protein [Neisseriales bacterium]